MKLVRTAAPAANKTKEITNSIRVNPQLCNELFIEFRASSHWEKSLNIIAKKNQFG
jgi:hypothetical protein